MCKETEQDGLGWNDLTVDAGAREPQTERGSEADLAFELEPTAITLRRAGRATKSRSPMPGIVSRAAVPR